MRRISCTLALLAVVGLDASTSTAFQDDAPQESLAAGLVAIYRGEAAGSPVEVCRIEPSIAFNFKATESPHPQIATQKWSGQWRGQIQLFRAGRYRFSAELAGRIRLIVAGQVVLVGESNSADEQLEGTEVDLPAGSVPLEAEYAKPADTETPHLRVFWKSAYFTREPLPWTVLRHAATDLTDNGLRSIQQDRGRFLVEELSCAACHRPDPGDKLASGLSHREGPDLSRVGDRVYPGWIDHWLQDPQSFRSQSVMPHLFGDDARGRAERYAVASFLESLGGPIKSSAQNHSREENANFRRRGERLFGRVGCTACHMHSTEKGQSLNELTNLGSKTTPERLAQYLRNPLSVDRSGRMPQMGLDGGEARDLAFYLCETRDESLSRELPALPGPVAEALQKLIDESLARASDATPAKNLSDAEKLRLVGKRLVVERSCTNCHRLEIDSRELPANPTAPRFASLRTARLATVGCLRMNADETNTSAPQFAITEYDRNCIELFLREASSGAGSPAPTYDATVTLERFRCLACHSRAGRGGLNTEQVDGLRRYETAQDAEAIRPPSLTEVGSRLQTSWLRAVLTSGRRSRPWMGLRMPQFGVARVSSLPDQLPACDGVEPSDEVREFPYDAEHVEAGRLLVGNRGFGCISCHDIAGQPNTGTRGPDLASMNERVRFDWYTRWLDDPQRIEPGTRMPTVFQNRTTAVKSVLRGDAAAQSQAIWEYLSLGANLPLPEGLERPRGLVLEPRDRSMIIRSFLPDTSPRGIAVGFPSGVSFAFDAAQCRLAYGWTGQFLNASPIWQNRGGAPAGIQGPRFWTAPQGCPWELSDSPGKPPNWSTRLTDPARGAQLLDGELFSGTRRVQFHDYTVDRDGNPIFQYRIDSLADGPSAPAATIREHFKPIQNLAGVGVVRSFEIQPTQTATAWLLIAEPRSPPTPFDDHGEPVAAELEAAYAELPAIGRSLLFRDGTGTHLVVTRTVPEDTRWIIESAAGQWRVSMRIPLTVDDRSSRIAVETWSPYRNEPAMIRELLGGSDSK